MIKIGQRSSEFFSNGEFKAPQLLNGPTSLRERETTLERSDKELFLRMMSKMLQWEPEKRSSAINLAEDDWIVTQLGR